MSNCCKAAINGLFITTLSLDQVHRTYHATPCKKAADVTIGMSRKGLRARRSPSQESDQVRKLVILRNLPPAESRRAAIRSVIMTRRLEWDVVVEIVDRRAGAGRGC